MRLEGPDSCVPTRPQAMKAAVNVFSGGGTGGDAAGAGKWSCNVCGRDFGTRNKLFIHIKDTGHALRGGAVRLCRFLSPWFVCEAHAHPPPPCYPSL